MTRNALIIAALAAVAGCAASQPTPAPQPPSAEAGQPCNAEPAQFLVGQQLTPVLADEARKASGAKTARVLRPGQAVTMEFNPFRVNVTVDRREVVTAVHCG